MSLKEIMDEKDPESRMFQMCGYLSIMDPSEVLPSSEIKECIDALTGRKETDDLRKELESAINRCSAENESNTPDWILASYLGSCLAAFDAAANARNKWYENKKVPK